MKRQITDQSIRVVQNKLKEEKGINISYEEAMELGKHFEDYMKVLPERLKRAKRRRNVKILILLVVLGLAVAYVLHSQ